MKITIIGAGNMGRPIGTRAIAGGHEVEILDRDPAEARAPADQLGGSANGLDPSAAFSGVSIQEPLGLGFGSTIKLIRSPANQRRNETR